MYENILELIKWWASHLLFVLIINLSVFGGYHAYQWYQTTQPYVFDASQLDDATLNQISQEIFEELKTRK